MSVSSRESRVESREAAAELPTTDSRLPTRLTQRVVVEHVRPEIDGGRFPLKRTVGESVEVRADIFADGHDEIVAVLRDRRIAERAEMAEGAEMTSAFSAASASVWHETPMTLAAPGTDECSARFDVGDMGWHEYSIVAWVDRFRTWRRDLRIKADAGQDLSVELLEGSMLVREASARAEQVGEGAQDANWLLTQADALCDPSSDLTVALSDELAALMDTYADRSRATVTEPRRVWVDRERARFGGWYEMFPRSTSPDPSRAG